MLLIFSLLLRVSEYLYYAASEQFFNFSLFCQVFVKNIPKDWFEDKLVPLFEPCGKIYDIRLILDPTTGLNKGFAFVCFCEKTEAQEAIKTVSAAMSFDWLAEGEDNLLCVFTYECFVWSLWFVNTLTPTARKWIELCRSTGLSQEVLVV